MGRVDRNPCLVALVEPEPSGVLAHRVAHVRLVDGHQLRHLGLSAVERVDVLHDRSHQDVRAFVELHASVDQGLFGFGCCLRQLPAFQLDHRLAVGSCGLCYVVLAAVADKLGKLLRHRLVERLNHPRHAARFATAREQLSAFPRRAGVVVHVICAAGLAADRADEVPDVFR